MSIDSKVIVDEKLVLPGTDDSRSDLATFLREKARIPEKYVDKILNLQSKIKSYKKTNLLACGYLVGNMPGEIQEAVGRSVGIAEDKHYLITILNGLPSPYELGVGVWAGYVYATGGNMDYFNVAFDLILADKIFYTIAPLITRKPMLRATSLFLLNPVVIPVSAAFYGKKTADGIRDSSIVDPEPSLSHLTAQSVLADYNGLGSAD